MDCCCKRWRVLATRSEQSSHALDELAFGAWALWQKPQAAEAQACRRFVAATYFFPVLTAMTLRKFWQKRIELASGVKAFY